VTAKSDIEAIKNQADLSDAERLWQAIEKLAEHIDAAPAAAAKLAEVSLAQQFRRLGR